MSRSQAMPHQNTVFRQLANRLPWAALERAIGEHRADRGVRKLRTREMLLSLLYAQLARAQPARHRGVAREPAGAALSRGVAAGAALDAGGRDGGAADGGVHRRARSPDPSACPNAVQISM